MQSWRCKSSIKRLKAQTIYKIIVGEFLRLTKCNRVTVVYNQIMLYRL